jgi:hypothetical protein
MRWLMRVAQDGLRLELADGEEPIGHRAQRDPFLGDGSTFGKSDESGHEPAPAQRILEHPDLIPDRERARGDAQSLTEGRGLALDENIVHPAALQFAGQHEPHRSRPHDQDVSRRSHGSSHGAVRTSGWIIPIGRGQQVVAPPGRAPAMRARSVVRCQREVVRARRRQPQRLAGLCTVRSAM